MARFGLDAGQYVTIIPNSGSHTHLPIDEPTPLLGVLGSCVELQDVASATTSPSSRGTPRIPRSGPRSRRWPATTRSRRARYRERVHARAARCSTCSTSSPPVPCRSRCTSTCSRRCARATTRSPPRHSSARTPAASPSGCCAAPARSGAGTYRGVCSGHLAQTPVNGTVFVFVRHPAIPFRPPENPHVADDHGRRGHRAGAVPRLPPGARGAPADQGVPIGRSLLFFGCRDPRATCCTPTSWRPSRSRAWHGLRACSREPGTPRRYVQDAMLDCADEVWDLLQQDAVVFVCGNAATIAPGVRASLDARSSGSAPAPARPTRRRGSPGCGPATGSWRTSGPDRADPPGGAPDR